MYLNKTKFPARATRFLITVSIGSHLAQSIFLITVSIGSHLAQSIYLSHLYKKICITSYNMQCFIIFNLTMTHQDSLPIFL
jgi:hypothetical protein